MVKSGYAKGLNSGHQVTEKARKPRPSARKGVSQLDLDFQE